MNVGLCVIVGTSSSTLVMDDSADDYDDYNDDEEVSYVSSESTDPIADLLDRYSVGIKPDYCVKFRKT